MSLWHRGSVYLRSPGLYPVRGGLLPCLLLRARVGPLLFELRRGPARPALGGGAESRAPHGGNPLSSRSEAMTPTCECALLHNDLAVLRGCRDCGTACCPSCAISCRMSRICSRVASTPRSTPRSPSARG